jgi:thymidine kinase
MIVGGMFSGKTEELIRRIIRAKYAGQRFVVFKHPNDSGRYDPVQLASHGGGRIMASVVGAVVDMERLIPDDARVIFIDEAQFYDHELTDFARRQRQAGRRVVIAGLNMDFAENPFPGPIPSLMALADDIAILKAACTICGRDAGFSQRTVQSGATVLVGAHDAYEARCKLHHTRE